MNAATVRRWPLVLIAAPAAVAIWSGWVGLGSLCGFGPIHPLPGIDGSLTIDTAITLPVGVEAYGAYALKAWLTPGTGKRAQEFARASAIGALLLGMCGQVIYHLLSAAHATRAPWPVTVAVSCMPVVTLGFGAAMTHLLRAGGGTGDEAGNGTSVPAGVLTAWYAPDGEDGHAARTDGEIPYGDGASVQARPVRAGAGEDPRTGTHTEPADRDAMVRRLADEIRDAAQAGERWRPDYPALQAETGFRRSWCEKVVADARRSVLEVPDARTTTQTRTEAGSRTGPSPGSGDNPYGDPDAAAPGTEPARTDEDRTAGTRTAEAGTRRLAAVT